MTVEEFLKKINIDLDYTSYDEYEIKLDVTIKDYKYQTKHLTEIEFDYKNKTIILKGKI